MKPTTEVELEVRYAETDQMALVHHSNYLRWFEVARTHHCEKTGHHYADIEELGYWLVVTGATVRYRQGARYGETVRVGCTVDWVATRALQFGYEVHCGERLLATGTSARSVPDRRSSSWESCWLPSS